MSFHPRHLRDLIRDVLRYLEPEIPYSEEAVELLMLTAAQETVLGKYLVQIHGPARGIFQMEPNTEEWLLDSLEKNKGGIFRKVYSLLSDVTTGKTLFGKDMVFNLGYQIAMARAFYFLKPGKIPASPPKQAEYYKKYWNTELGAATVAEALMAYHSLCTPVLS